MARRHHHPSDAEKAYNRVVWAVERQHEQTERQQGAAAVRRRQQREWYRRVAGVALAAAALLAGIGIVVRWFL
jgi:hypothetical protein